MKKVFAIIAIVVLGISALLFQLFHKQDLRTTLEEVQAKAHLAVRNADPDAFARHVSARTGRDMPDINEFKKACSNKAFQDSMLNDVFLDLRKKANFLTIKTEPGWAAYYAETDLDDPNYTSASMFLFKQEGQSWKACGVVYGLTKARPESKMAKSGMAAWKNREDMLNIIKTDPRFDLVKLIKKRTEEVQQ
jgi:hypothetical protein